MTMSFRLFSALTLSALCSLSSLTPTAAQTPKRVILMIADGAGVAHWTLAKLAKPDLAVSQFGVSGLVNTRGADHIVTGSAAGATALATGARTVVGAIGVGPDSTPLQTVLELANARGMATGLVTTTWVVDATPAAFASHVPERGMLVDIFQQMIQLPVDVILFILPASGGRITSLLSKLSKSIATSTGYLVSTTISTLEPSKLARSGAAETAGSTPSPGCTTA